MFLEVVEYLNVEIRHEDAMRHAESGWKLCCLYDLIVNYVWVVG